MRKLLAGLLLVTTVTLSTTASAEDTIRIKLDDCVVVAEYVANYVAGQPVPSVTGDVEVVAQYIIAKNPDIDTLPPTIIFQLLVNSCFEAEGVTDIPVSAKAIKKT